MNTGVPWPEADEGGPVLRIQTELHQWAIDEPNRRFDDLFNLVCDPAVLVVAWARVRGNKGKRSAGVDQVRPDSVLAGTVRERMIPKPGTSKRRRLGTPTARDRTVQLRGGLPAVFLRASVRGAAHSLDPWMGGLVLRLGSAGLDVIVPSGLEEESGVSSS